MTGSPPEDESRRPLPRPGFEQIRNLLDELRKDSHFARQFHDFDFEVSSAGDLVHRLAEFRDFIQGGPSSSIEISVYIDSADDDLIRILSRSVEMLAIEMGYGQPVDMLVH